MKKIILVIMLGFCMTYPAIAQFILTPSNGLMVSGNAYSIKRTATEKENIELAKAAIKEAIPDGHIESDVNSNNSFSVTSKATIKMGKKGARELEHKGEYTLHVESTSEDIKVIFTNLGSFEHEQGSILIPRAPTTKSILNYYIFKNDGDVRHPKAKLAIENWANNLVSRIEELIRNHDNT